jgi:fructokinase
VIVVAGEALIDLLPVPGGEHQFAAWPGGAPCNVAAGLARLGRPACFLGRLSTDAFGGMLRQHLRQAGVDLSLAAVAAEPTTLGVAFLDSHGRAEYSFYATGTADWQWAVAELPAGLPAGAQALYVGGLSLRLPPGAALLEALMRRVHARDEALVFFDPNVRDSLGFAAGAERARVEQQLGLAHVVKASHDDIGLLYPGRDYRDVAAEWHGLTSGIVVVTLGPAGVYAIWAQGEEITLPAAPAEVVDTIGAGDAFASALLDGLAGAMPPGTAPAPGLVQVGTEAGRRLLWRASVSAAYTCERPGAESADAPALAAALGRAGRVPASSPDRSQPPPAAP